MNIIMNMCGDAVRGVPALRSDCDDVTRRDEDEETMREFEFKRNLSSSVSPTRHEVTRRDEDEETMRDTAQRGDAVMPMIP